MKRIKAVNGYTIYQYTKIDARDGHEPGEFCIFFSADVRELGTSYSYPEYEDIETIDICLELVNGDNYGKAVEIVSSETTAVSWDMIEKKARELDKIAAGNAPRTIDTAARYDRATARKLADTVGALKPGDTVRALGQSVTIGGTVYYSDIFSECIDTGVYVLYFDCEFIDTAGKYHNYKSIYDGGTVVIR